MMEQDNGKGKWGKKAIFSLEVVPDKQPGPERSFSCDPVPGPGELETHEFLIERA